MISYCSDVKAFHDKFGLVTPPSFTQVPQDLHEFRVLFFNEEFNEFVESHEKGDVATALDSLIDLVYITCGAALLHGIQVEEFDEQRVAHLGDNIPGRDLFTGYDVNPKPGLLNEDDYLSLRNKLRISINTYKEGYAMKNETMIRRSLDALYTNCFLGAHAMGAFDNKCFDEMWTDVQRANMTKERALRAEDSKRGSQWDVIKPVGWVPPQTEAILAKYL